LGAVLAEEHGARVLLVDCDPQASLTQAAGLRSAEGCSLAEVMGGAAPGTLPLSAVIQSLSLIERPATQKIERILAIAPADIALATTELGLTARMGRENVLRRVLASVGRDFDIVLLDCAPSLGLLTVNALTAADGVIVPTIPQAADLRGLRLFLDSVTAIRRELNPALQVLGVLVTFYDSRLKHHAAAIETMELAGLDLFLTRIGRTVRIAEAAGAGQPVTEYEPRNPQAEAYRDLAQEVEAWRERNRG
jgi:chromosome partitioning protein